MKITAIVIGSVVAFVALIVGIGLLTIKYQTSQGEHTGYVTVAETDGIFFKTHVVYVKTNTTSSQEDEYCVIDPAVYQQMQSYAGSQQHVDMYYVDWFKRGMQNCKAETEGIITKVIPIAN